MKLDRNWLSLLVMAVVVAAVAEPAHAGRGSSPAAIGRAIGSGSADAITSELERAEHLVCAGCVPLVRPLVDHADRRVREVAAWWLVRRGLRRSLVADMARRLEGGDSIKARNGADVIGATRCPEAIAHLSAALDRRALDGDARSAIARALGAIGDLAALPALSSALAAPEAQVRAAALESLRELRGFDDAGAALGALSDADAGVRVEAIYTIGATRQRALQGPSGAALASALTQKLAQIVGGDPNAGVRRKAAWALGEIGAPADLAGPALGQAAHKDADPLVRSIANAALGKLTR